MTKSPTSSLIIEMHVPQVAENKYNKKGRTVKLRACNRLWENVSEILRVAKRNYSVSGEFSLPGLQTATLLLQASHDLFVHV